MKLPTDSDDPSQRALFPRALGGFIFFSRWLQAPLYLGLIVAQGVYVWLFMEELRLTSLSAKVENH
jgi:uncharacterized membrane protein YqhA